METNTLRRAIDKIVLARKIAGDKAVNDLLTAALDDIDACLRKNIDPQDLADRWG